MNHKIAVSHVARSPLQPPFADRSTGAGRGSQKLKPRVGPVRDTIARVCVGSVPPDLGLADRSTAHADEDSGWAIQIAPGSVVISPGHVVLDNPSLAQLENVILLKLTNTREHLPHAEPT